MQVTNGGSEANYITTWNLVEPGDEVVMMVPNYMQTWGLARAFGATVTRVAAARNADAPLARRPRRARRARHAADEADRHLQPEQPDRRALRRRAIWIASPRSPAQHGAWILSDEIYRGAELDGRETPTMWGRYDRVIVTSGLSKAYGLPGLRIGWIVGAAGARRGAVVVPRLHDDRARRAERRARAACARAGAPDADSRPDARHPEPRTSR